MANIIIRPWGETPGERSLRQKGHRTKQEEVLEIGVEFGADMIRSNNAGDAMKKIANALWNLRQAMADRQWDDEKVLVVMGIQARNGYVKDVDGQWVEEGSEQWLNKIAKK
jgi:hypothetical protein